MSDDKKRKFGFSSTRKLLDIVLGTDYFRPDPEEPPVIPYHRVDGSKDNPLVLVLGENAAGKSFFRRVVASVVHYAKQDTEFISISMQGRTSVSMAPWTAMVYGDESYESTGTISSKTVTAGIRTCLSRESRHIAFWDEPDLGLSDRWAAGAGKALREFGEQATKHTIAAFITTHSRALVSQVAEGSPTYLYLGETPSKAPQTLHDWLSQPVYPLDIEKLAEISHKRFRKINAIFKRAGIKN